VDLTPLLAGGLITLQIAIGSWLVAVLVGLLIVGIRELNIGPINRLLDAFVTGMRATPELVLLYIVYFGVAYLGIRLGSLPAAIIALGVSEAAFTSEYLRASILTVSQRQRLAAFSLGMSTLQSFRFIVIPQAIPFAIPPLVNVFVGLLKTATLASAVGAPEILYAGTEEMRRSGDILFVTSVIVIIYVVATLPLTALAGMLEKRARARLGA
jgi:cystine transport system permease protein